MLKLLEKSMLLIYYNIYGWLGRYLYPFKLKLQVGNVRFWIATSQRSRKLLGENEAVILGHDVYVRSTKAFTETLIRHEMKHAEQFDTDPVGYTFGISKELDKHGYRNSKYERAARRAEPRNSKLSKRIKTLPRKTFVLNYYYYYYIAYGIHKLVSRNCKDG